MNAVDDAAAVLGPVARRDVPLGPLTTYRVGGPAALFVEITDDAVLRLVSGACRASGLPVLVVGRGSNLLVSERGFSGIAIVLASVTERIDIDATTVRATAAVSLPVLARQTVAAGLTGLEWAVGVPGSVGGGVRMNAGGHGGDIAATLRRVRVFDVATGEDRQMVATDLHLAFRRSVLTDHEVVLEAEFELVAGDRAKSEDELADIVRWRRENQPGGQNAGSVFVNPLPDSAGRIIDSLGLRGLRHGSAHVSEKHANFIQSDDDGLADDVYALLVEVRRRVASVTGIVLRPELRLVGFPPLPAAA